MNDWLSKRFFLFLVQGQTHMENGTLYFCHTR